MEEKDYTPGQIVVYTEEGGKWRALVLENNCSDGVINYTLMIFDELSRPIAGFKRIIPGRITHYQRPNDSVDSVFVGNGSIEGLFDQTIKPIKASIGK